MRWARFVIACMLTAASAAFVAVRFGDWRVQQLESAVVKLEKEKADLRDFASRLSASRRVGQVNVLEQKIDNNNRVQTRLRWQEIGGGGVLDEPREIEAIGKQVYFEAYVLKFESSLVGIGDKERGESLALFRRIFGDGQAPATAAEFERANRPRTSTQPAKSNDDALWGRFWEFTENPQLASTFGVRVAQIEAPAISVSPGDVLEVTLDAAGGLNIRKLRPEP